MDSGAKFRRGQHVYWEGYEHLGAREIMDCPLWDSCWKSYTYSLGGLARIPEAQLYQAAKRAAVTACTSEGKESEHG